MHAISWRAVASPLLGLALCAPAAVAHAQTDYYNTDAGRPIRVEDAYAIERRAIELQVAPLRLERLRSKPYEWGVEPEVAFGLLPRTQVEVGFPIVHAEGGRSRMTSLAGIDISALHNLNVETRLPALALVADVILPVGGSGPSRAVPSLKAIATKTFPQLRVHLNAQRSFISTPTSAGAGVPAHGEQSRWMAGVAVDRPFPLSALLITAELVTSAPVEVASPRRLDAAGGMRYQWSPRVAFDAGGGYRLRGHGQGWFLTTGAAVAVGLPWVPRS